MEESEEFVSLVRANNSDLDVMEGTENIGAVYTVAIPVMLIFCVITVVVNSIIVLSSRWCRKPMSPTLRFSISLALADAWSTLIVGLGLILNSLVPKVYKIQLHSDCYSLVLEVFRLGGILVANIHLLALAINHWIGIALPLHYAATMTRRTAWVIIMLSWICPMLLIFVIFCSTNGMGFLSEACRNWNFLEERAFRGVFASLFFAPLVLMCFAYSHIFAIVRKHRNHQLRYQNSVQLKKNVKATMTTVLILGTYILGFMPATLYNIIVCTNCVVNIKLVPSSIRISWGIVVNTLVILKALVDPVIYAARMSDIQVALKKMRYDIFKSCFPSCVEPFSSELERAFSSKYGRYPSQTIKSHRLSSFGSTTNRKSDHSSKLSLQCAGPSGVQLRVLTNTSHCQISSSLIPRDSRINSNNKINLEVKSSCNYGQSEV